MSHTQSKSAPLWNRWLTRTLQRKPEIQPQPITKSHAVAVRDDLYFPEGGIPYGWPFTQL